MRICLFCVVFALGLVSTVMGAVVNAPDDGARWRAVVGTDVSLSWDWTWEWVPASAASVRLVVRGARGRVVHDAVYARPAGTADIDFGAVTDANEDVYTATLTFLSESGEELAARSATLDVLYGYSGAAKVRGGEKDTPQWMDAGGNRAVIPYPEGNTMVKGRGLTTLVYKPEGAAEPLYVQDVNFTIFGLLLLLK